MLTARKALPKKFDTLTHQITTPDGTVLRSSSYKSQEFFNNKDIVRRLIIRDDGVRILNTATLELITAPIRSINSLKAEWSRNKDIVTINNIEFHVCWSRNELIAASENYVIIPCRIEGYRATGILYGEKFNEIIYHN